jgi:hypothetical protein
MAITIKSNGNLVAIIYSTDTEGLRAALSVATDLKATEIESDTPLAVVPLYDPF